MSIVFCVNLFDDLSNLIQGHMILKTELIKVLYFPIVCCVCMHIYSYQQILVKLDQFYSVKGEWN